MPELVGDVGACTLLHQETGQERLFEHTQHHLVLRTRRGCLHRLNDLEREGTTKDRCLTQQTAASSGEAREAQIERRRDRLWQSDFLAALSTSSLPPLQSGRIILQRLAERTSQFFREEGVARCAVSDTLHRGYRRHGGDQCPNLGIGERLQRLQAENVLPLQIRQERRQLVRVPQFLLAKRSHVYFAREKCTSFYAKSVPKDSLTKIVFNRKAYQFLREKCATPDTQMPQTSATATGSPLPSPNGSWCWSC